MNLKTNSRKEAFLKSIPTASIDSKDDKLSIKCKFNFAYMDFNQQAGQHFNDWDVLKLVDLLDKLVHFSKEPLTYWLNERCGAKNNHVLEIYDKFPTNSHFTHPSHVPHQARWARFRLESSVRLIGFTLPSAYHKKEHEKTKCLFDCNTFYVVFLDANHRFYITK